MAMRRVGDEQALEALFNFADGPREIPVQGGRSELLLSSDEPRYGGQGRVRLDRAAARLPGHSAVLLGSRP